MSRRTVIGRPSHGAAGVDAGGAAGREAGFTLLEILVALVVLGILLATLSRGVQFGIAAFDRQDRMVDTAGRLEAVDRTLRRLVTEADPGTSSDGKTLVGRAHAMAFRAPLPTAQDGAGLAPFADPDQREPDQRGQQMADLSLTVEGGALVLSSLPYRHVIPTTPPPRPLRSVLLQGIAGIDLSYWSQGGWHSVWDSQDLPDLVRIRLLFPDGDRRRWPDIVAAPARHQ